MNPIIEILADITYARASFYRRHSIVPYQLMRQFLANEAQMLTLLTQLRSPPAPPPAPAPLAHNFDIPLNLVQLLFGRDATVGLGQGQGNPRFWENVVVGLTPQQFAAGTRNYENPPDVAELYLPGEHYDGSGYSYSVSWTCVGRWSHVHQSSRSASPVCEQLVRHQHPLPSLSGRFTNTEPNYYKCRRQRQRPRW